MTTAALHAVALPALATRAAPAVPAPADLAAAARATASLAAALCAEPSRVRAAAGALGSLIGCALVGLLALRHGAAALEALGPVLALPLGCLLGALGARGGEALGRRTLGRAIARAIGRIAPRSNTPASGSAPAVLSSLAAPWASTYGSKAARSSPRTSASSVRSTRAAWASSTWSNS